MNLPHASFILLTLTILMTATTQAAPTSAPSSPRKPHLVLYIADDFSAADCGNPDIRTPNLNKLAEQSLRLTRAFCASPTCTPSRCAMYTGLYPFRNGAHSNHSYINEGIRTLPMYLKDLGYRVVLAGKTHIGPRDQFPFEYLPNSNLMPPGKKHVLWTDLNPPAIDDLLTHHDPAQPLCLVIASHSPHVYWRDNEGYDPTTIHLPPYLVDTPETRAMRCKYYSDVTWLDNQLGAVLDSLQRHHFADNTLFIFTADHGAQWPNSKWSLYDAGINVPLLIRWPGVIQPNTKSQSLFPLVDILPTFIQAAGGTPPTDIDGRSALALLRNPSESHRQAIFATHTGDKEMNRAPMRCIRTTHYKYIQNLAPEIKYTTHISEGGSADGATYWRSWEAKAQQDPQAKFLIDRYRHHPAEELYDLENDPNEFHNLAADPDHQPVLNQLRQQLHDWRVRQQEDLTKVPMPEDGRQGALRYAD
ncbi:MAG TPA: sulfatase [Tepidisphaeraceae bacterium]|jgi:arylsulfatase A-like enzyme